MKIKIEIFYLDKKIVNQEDLDKTSNSSTPQQTTPSKSGSSVYPISFLSSMNFVGRVAKGVKDFYNEINPATLTGIFYLKNKKNLLLF